jgi:uncharacterized protein
MEPTHTGSRLKTLDALRGFAVLGIFVVNLPFMALPMAATEHPPASGSELVAWFLTKALFEMKFWTTFSLLFGFGVGLQLERAAARGEPDQRAFFGRRFKTLAVIGLLHGLLLFEGDVLLLYALCAAPLLALSKLRPERLLILGLSLSLMTCAALGAAATEPVTVAPDPGAITASPPPEAPLDIDFEELVMLLETPDAPRFKAFERQARERGPARARLQLRAAIWMLWQLVSALLMSWRVVGCFLIGLALQRLGALRRDDERWRWRALVAAALLALPLELASAAQSSALLRLPEGLAFALGAAHGLSSLLLALGYAAALTLFVERRPGSIIARALATTGRMALTNYLAQSLFAALLFEAWGLALFGRCSRLELLAIAGLVYLGQLGLSALWLGRFGHGPMEWLWRRASYGKAPSAA